MMKTIPVNPTKWPQKQKRFLALIATVAISDRATFVAILELLRLLQKIWSRIERNQMSDTPRTDSEKQRFILEDNLDDTEMVPSEFCEKLERELNAANERIKQLEADAYKSTQKIQRLEGWNTQNCADKVILMETLRDREERIKRMEEVGDKMASWLKCERNLGNDTFMAHLWDEAKKPLNDRS